ncbi:MAG TPA: hypothetical protein VG448_04910, partial [Solirubrobacterales bacterium]|nr:hypothetical protein [Solirubrobacterales bacterium]
MGIDTYGLPTTTQIVPSELASPTRNSVAYLAYQSALPNSTGATGVADVYEAEREADGWATTRRLTLSGSETRLAVPQGVSPDHRYAFDWSNDNLSPLNIGEQLSLYVMKPDDSFELAGIGSLGTEPYAQGRYIGEGGKHVVFSTGRFGLAQSFLCSGNPKCKVRQLEPEAAPTGTGAVYDREVGGETHVVSLLPGEEPLKEGEEAYWKGTSKDGSATAFEAEGALYVRLDNAETKEVAAGNPVFAGVSDNGGYVFYVVPSGSEEAGVIHRFDTATGADIVVNPGDEGLIVNVSGDGSHVYFISKAQLDGAKGSVGEPNLYVWSDGEPRYVATVLPSDLVQTSDAGNGVPGLGDWIDGVIRAPKTSGEVGPGNDSSRTTPDGRVIVFESKAKLTTYENAEHTEIYRYVDGAAGPECISCDFEKAPQGEAQLQDLLVTPASDIIHNLSEDGSRVFFETDEALVPEDTDGINDIYEWMEGAGSAKLISSGRSSQYPHAPGFNGSFIYNVLLSVTPDAGDVVFVSQDTLVSGAPEGGTAAIYDARVNGGFPSPSEPAICVEEGCKQAAAIYSPSFRNQASESIQGSGNVKPKKKHKRHCRKSKHKTCSKHKHKSKSGRRRTHRSLARASSAVSETGAPGRPASSTEQVAAADATPIQGPLPFAAAADSPLEYGLEAVSAETSTTAAGGHPDFTSNLVLDHGFKENGELDESKIARTEEVRVSVPPGLIGNINAVPRCATGELFAFNCPTDAQVGITKVLVTWLNKKLTEPIYNMVPPHPNNEIARFGFIAGFFPTFIDIRVRTASDYGVTATVYGSSGEVSLVSAETMLWGNPASPAHDKERLTPLEAPHCKTACEAKNGKGEIIGERPSTIPLDQRKAFMTNPSACQSGEVGILVKSYQFPDPLTASAPLPDITDCTGLPFAPTFEAEPTNHTAGAPTGLKTKLLLPQHLGEEERSTATMREARVTLPAGMQIAAGAAN